MSVELVTGLQGSGKSYYASYLIWKHIKKMHQAEINGDTYKYKMIYTNIEGFQDNKFVKQIDVTKIYKMWEWELKQYQNYEKRMNYVSPPDLEFVKENKKSHRSSKPREFVIDAEVIEDRTADSKFDNIEKFESNDKQLLKYIQIDSETIPKEFIDYTKPYFEKMGFTHCLIVLDEAHNYFGQGLKAPLLRLVSYHRHYDDQDYLLITQDPKMLSAKVTALTAYTIRAVNPIMRWRKDIFTYNVYSGGYISFSGSNKLETKSLKANDYIFQLYESGGKKSQESHFMKIILRMLAVVAILGAISIYSLNNMGDEKKEQPKQKTTDTKKESPYIPKPRINHTSSNTELVKFIMANDKLVHMQTNKKFNLKNFEQLTKGNAKAVSYEKNGDGSVTIYYEIDTKTIQLLEIGKDENTQNNTSTYRSHF